MKTKALVIALSAIFLFSLSGCVFDSDENAESKTEPAIENTTLDETDKTDSLSTTATTAPTETTNATTAATTTAPAATTPAATTAAPAATTKETTAATAAATTAATTTAAPATDGITVYITDTGTKYHNEGCQYLSDSKHAISLEAAKAQGYTPCSRCHAPQ